MHMKQERDSPCSLAWNALFCQFSCEGLVTASIATREAHDKARRSSLARVSAKPVARLASGGKWGSWRPSTQRSGAARCGTEATERRPF